ncbi:MAG: phosphatidylserine decarboxylase family protein [Deltaproteobacteria bacterium]|nr:phosphatidylserine decarboxylase family protein [Deltaproteobacteria bacterium]
MNKFSWPDPTNQSAFPIARPGYSFIGAAAFTTFVFALLGLIIPALLGLASTFFIIYFFRDPDRTVPNAGGLVVSPADGKVVAAGTVENSTYYDGKCLKISIFMSVFNVHVNRMPCKGKVKKISYNPGKYFSANLDKASKENEQNAVYLETEDGKEICTVQIAGLIARRIICKVQESDEVDRGQRFGMICFGSRLDVYLPTDSKLKVAVGDIVKAGTSVLGELT